MNLRRFALGLCVACMLAAWSGAAWSGAASAQTTTKAEPPKMVGMYVHQHWPYHHPYAARTWTVDDWTGYADGLHRLGFNTIMIWPVLETMPEPLTPSDRANLEKISRVIDVLHRRFQMRVWIALAPNVVADNITAAQATFERRHFFHCDLRVNPGDREAVRRMVAWREQLFRPLAQADAVSIIDSDPGGYPGSTNREFVDLLVEHRKMFDRLRPGIELVYWIHAGWPAYCRFYQTNSFAMGKPEEYEEALRMLVAANPEPWSVANGLDFAKKLRIEPRVTMFRYGAIEGEPSFPMTNFGGDAAYAAGNSPGPRGVMGNAQTHCVQLPNTFAFARGAQGKPIGPDDYAKFADELIPGRGRRIAAAWKAIGGEDPRAMRAAEADLLAMAIEPLQSGPLRGLLVGNPKRFVVDLAMMLRLKAACAELAAAVDRNREVRAALADFLRAAEPWQKRHGYMNSWWWPQLHAALAKLNAPEINAVLNPKYEAETPYGEVREMFYRTESQTPRLIEAIKAVLARMPQTAAK